MTRKCNTILYGEFFVMYCSVHIRKYARKLHAIKIKFCIVGYCIIYYAEYLLFSWNVASPFEYALNKHFFGHFYKESIFITDMILYIMLVPGKESSTFNSNKKN